MDRSLEGDKKFAYSKLTDGPECDVYEKQNFKMSDDWFVGYSKKKNSLYYNIFILLNNRSTVWSNHTFQVSIKG